MSFLCKIDQCHSTIICENYLLCSRQINKDSNYSRGSNTERVRYSDGRICSVFKWRSVFEWSAILKKKKKFPTSLGRFIYTKTIFFYIKRPRLFKNKKWMSIRKPNFQPSENRTFHRSKKEL